MLLHTGRYEWKKARSVNQTSNGYVSKVPTATEPVGDAGTATGAAVIETGGPQSPICDNGIQILFYGIASNNNTSSARLIGWRSVGVGVTSTATGNPDASIWIPTVLFEVSVTYSSTPVGLTGKAILNTELFADTITITGTTANAGISVDVVSPANDTVAHMTADFKGFQKLEFSFTTGGSATSCNALYAFV